MAFARTYLADESQRIKGKDFWSCAAKSLHFPRDLPRAPNMTDSPPQATVVIVTKNRKDDLRRALSSTFMQSGVTFDVLVFDDASTDGTLQMVREEFPQARLHLSEVSTGHIVHRNRGTELARSPIVVIIDDDSA